MKSHFLTTILYTLILTVVLNSSYAKNKDFNYNAKNISNYFSAILSFHNLNYEKSENFFKKINDSEKNSTKQSSKYIQSLINSGKYIEAERYSKGLENKKKSNFESKLILGLSEFKKENYIKAKKYFNEIEKNREHLAVSRILKISLNIWSSIEEDGISSIQNIPERYNNFKIIQNTLANCFFDTNETTKVFNEILNNKKENFSRYYFFYANYLINQNKKLEANEIINYASKKYPNNLLINQLKKTYLDKEKNYNNFNCKNKNHIIAEIFYIISNALSTQTNYELSNFYANLSKYLNPKFSSYNSLLGENFFVLKKYEKSKKIFNQLSKTGSVYKWYSSRQIAFILYEQNKKDEAVKSLTKSYKKINPSIYQTYDFANFLRNNEDYESSIKLYTTLLSKINKNHELYPKILDRRGTAYERVKKLELSEKDLLMSLKISPNQPYVINYLAYSWLEQGKNLDKSLEMLRKANELKRDDGYITDSLGWALYKLNKFEESKKFLKAAIILMPQDPIVNDHFADCLWKNNQKIQARYYWNYVLELKDTEKKLKKSIKNKLIFGLEKG
ncbi:MAG: hypothetical protein CMG67_01695 [Candidatus Marinimicrobia bacterium]|nr:hypothetical protein [Candidatus Neomarinimicrobiota bacterium]|tara:strand:+ start:1463 stop:3148 length:1686 start_codon:yes stop_codon:yes gene_type:complete